MTRILLHIIIVFVGLNVTVALQETFADAPPLFIAAATNDEYNLQLVAASLYVSWVKAKHPAELHIYAKGGHGFGLKKQGLPTDTWTDRFIDWLTLQGLLKP